jgi:hypothetical protein
LAAGEEALAKTEGKAESSAHRSVALALFVVDP